jgi:hypothetical protein
MKENYPRFFSWLCGFEGYDSNVKGDPGGRTIWGVSERYFPNEVKAMLAMSQEEAKQYAYDFYKKTFWDANNCDLLPAPLDVIHADTCVNPGPAVARKIYNETRDWKDYLFKRIGYYSLKVQEDPDKAKFFRGWVNRCITLWARYQK